MAEHVQNRWTTGCLELSGRFVDVMLLEHNDFCVVFLFNFVLRVFLVYKQLQRNLINSGEFRPKVL